MAGDDRGTLAMVREALVEALALDVVPAQIAADQPLYEHPIAMDSLGFYRVIVELEVRRGGRFDQHALEHTLFETVDDIVLFLTAQARP